MHILDRFQASCGATASLPKLDTAFFPIPFDKYITINTICTHENQNYDYWQDVLKDILPILNIHNITLVQIGDNNAQNPTAPLIGTYDLRGKLNIKQISYVISNSLLHISGDSFCADIANIVGVKNCEVFGATPAHLTCPSWKPELSNIIRPEKIKNLPLLFPEDKKIINTIKPEKISSCIIKNLSLNPISQFPETQYIGSRYHQPVVDVVPDHAPIGSQLANNLMHFRLDYHFDQNQILPWSQAGRKLVVVTDRELNLSLLSQCKASIHQIAYEVSTETKKEYLQSLISLGRQVTLFSRTEDLDLLSKLRLKLIDYNIEHRPILTKKNLDLSQEIEYTDLYYMSSRLVLSKGKQFPSKHAYLSSIEINQWGNYPLSDCDEFWDEQDHFRIIKKNA